MNFSNNSKAKFESLEKRFPPFLFKSFRKDFLEGKIMFRFDEKRVGIEYPKTGSFFHQKESSTEIKVHQKFKYGEGPLGNNPCGNGMMLLNIFGDENNNETRKITEFWQENIQNATCTEIEYSKKGKSYFQKKYKFKLENGNNLQFLVSRNNDSVNLTIE